MALAVAGRLDSIVDWIGRCAAWCGLAMVVLIAFDVLLRYMFRLGPVWMQEMEWHLISPIALIGMSYALRHNEHVRVELIYERLGPTARAWIDLAASLTTLAIAVIVFDLSLGMVAQSYAAGETSPDPGGLPYRYLLKSFIPFGFALLALQAIAHSIRHALKLTDGDGRG